MIIPKKVLPPAKGDKPRPTKIPMIANARENFRAHPFPVQSPLAATRNRRPSMNRNEAMMVVSPLNSNRSSLNSNGGSIKEKIVPRTKEKRIKISPLSP